MESTHTLHRGHQLGRVIVNEGNFTFTDYGSVCAKHSSRVKCDDFFTTCYVNLALYFHNYYIAHCFDIIYLHALYLTYLMIKDQFERIWL